MIDVERVRTELSVLLTYPARCIGCSIIDEGTELFIAIEGRLDLSGEMARQLTERLNEVVSTEGSCSMWMVSFSSRDSEMDVLMGGRHGRYGLPSGDELGP